MRVSFSEAGSRDSPVILCIPPSFCSRYVAGPNFELRARKFGVRVITVDRPGMGGTERCSTEERLEVSAKHVTSVLEYLGVHKAAIVTHSSGAIFTLDLLANYPAVVGPSPRVYLMSSWIPTSMSSQFGLQLIPSPLVGNQHKFLPTFVSIAKGVGPAFAFSSGFINHSRKEKEKKENDDWVIPERFRKEGEKYEPKAPYHVKLSNSSEIGKCIDKSWYRKTVAAIARGYVARGDKVMIEQWWAEKDGLVPKKGRDWFDELMSTAGDAIEYHSAELEGLGHDDPTAKIEVVGAIFEDVREHA
ncbi:alpha/beta-hydrolase [Calocera cornea HHB12733]|uniref:Alpha/beta-hydrolase n=1 Tax=Calocera cornea HHB12733 TaxID=1353952 RepID=A0A165JLD7_9BASI|nr:alpha/beta-hydrolase [Calocera cornea HHB12733]